MTAPALLCATLEVALNRLLRLEPSVLAECASLHGRCIALDIDGLGWTFFLEFVPSGVAVLEHRAVAPDVRVRGGLATLMRLVWRVTHGESGLPQGLHVEGETELLIRFNRMLARVGFDPEEFAATFLGDASAHRLVQGLEQVLQWTRRTASTLGLDTAEYLREETRDLARAVDVEDWMNAVDDLREAVDRFEARLQRLEARIR